ncbi:unnamed protein product [Paramecium octaurelia]|uniref:Copper transporter n=1 Tax=Paramecium octaurelia TaxID=43137 RepID=A0A8S1S2U1_PAROT|nr:unnamed protein product [Paramecium octaurelia]
MMMDMYVYWTAKCEFIFESWRIYDDQPFLLFCGCFLSCLYSIIHIMYMLQGEKVQIFMKQFMSRRIGFSIYQFFLTLSSMITMMLLMTMNGWVNIAVGVGYTIGYGITQITKPNSKYTQVDSI